MKLLIQATVSASMFSVKSSAWKLTPFFKREKSAESAPLMLELVFGFTDKFFAWILCFKNEAIQNQVFFVGCSEWTH